MSLLLNMLLFISCLLLRSTVILEPKKIKSVTASNFPPSICHEVMGPDAMIKEHAINIIIINETLLIFFSYEVFELQHTFQTCSTSQSCSALVQGLGSLIGLRHTHHSPLLKNFPDSLCPLWLVESITRVKSCHSSSWLPWESCFASLRTVSLSVKIP